MQTVNQSIALATARVKSAVSGVDAKFQLIAIPPNVSPRDNPGQIAAHLAANNGRAASAKTFFKSVGKIKSELYAEHAKAQKLLDAAKARAGEFIDAADFIKTGKIMSNITDPLIQIVAEQIRKGLLAGAIPPTYPDQLKQIGINALMQLNEASAKIDTVKSAGRVAYSHNLAKALETLKDHAGYSEADCNTFKWMHYRTKTAFETRRAEHRANYRGDAK